MCDDPEFYAMFDEAPYIFNDIKATNINEL